MNRFAGQAVFVTGGNKGIGRGIAKRFAEEGAKVAIAAIEKDTLEAAAALANETGAEIIGLALDVTDAKAVREAYAEAEAKLGAISVSVQNAGVITIAKVENLTEREWDLNLDVNTKGVFLCCQEAIRRFRASGMKGRLINTASGQARQGFIYTPHYAASKFGVVGLSQSLAKELAREGITVNAICPGIIHTEMWDYNDRVWGQMLGEYGPGELMAEWVEGIPMGRAGTPAEVAALVSFLASADAAYITGQTINVDGGLIMS
ncbi:SDR family oxidoreductase [Rhizobium leucaenae]|jgi:meso-butanediol dehydrogenase/(S,S)-butanediol dehydrogenase/diacetyl reductase|uniref:Meso-butanediol dehydrogenase/(S,S)-butanediol dehydrogenase/diacetyl reductase n=1 Tax=Rhizobium leucaenae TaxID=29450 RepID=A0A7W6ZZ90_9HYPH|nr:SDR family oxidoreductase [Rhizobium leucaenae]MBB4571522.1 meso-butanediol dehydrogenase/(S,S)-butanediol dehydrogenase/diacetyl reductase [Rhizobium leucaenae]